MTPHRDRWGALLVSTLLYLLAGLASLYVTFPLEPANYFFWEPGTWWTALFTRGANFGGLGLLAAAGVMPWKPRLGHAIAAAGALFVLAWFVQLEHSFYGWGTNTWIAFNSSRSEGIDRLRVQIVGTWLLIAAVGWSIRSLLPQRLVKIRRWWQPFAMATACLIAWYLMSVSPYRVPVIADGMRADLTILHVQKDGMRFRESTISVIAYRRLCLTSQIERRYFQYRFSMEYHRIECPREVGALVDRLNQAMQGTGNGTPPNPIRQWKADRWYVYNYGPRGGLFHEFSEGSGKLPAEVVDLANMLETAGNRVPPDKWEVRDICFGFCYGPLAGLGFQNLNDQYIKR